MTGRVMEPTDMISQFPYGDGQTTNWFEEVIVRPGGAEPGGMPVRKSVKMVNFNSKSEDLISFGAEVKVLENTSDDEVVYYHSTTSNHAINILKSGIDLTKSRGRQDFSNGNGFYVMKKINKAVEWAKEKAHGTTGAIIAFKISKSLENEKPYLPLEVQTANGKKWWRRVVSCYRGGKNNVDNILLQHNVKFITGPVSKRDGIPHDFNQTCIRDTDYAKRYGSLQNILFVIFIR